MSMFVYFNVVLPFVNNFSSIIVCRVARGRSLQRKTASGTENSSRPSTVSISVVLKLFPHCQILLSGDIGDSAVSLSTERLSLESMRTLVSVGEL